MLSNAISDLVGQLKERGARRVVLQFPEGLKRMAPATALALKDAGFEIAVSGDPCYGACDLATDTLEGGDVLVHAGHAPVDDRKNVIFLPYAMDFDIAILDAALPFIEGKTTGLVTTVQHAHLVPAMEEYLRNRGIDVKVADGSGRTPIRGQVLGCSFSAARVPGAEVILYVGTGLFHPVGIALATKATVVALDPFAGTVQEVSGERLLRRRFAVIERAKTAETIGILVSSKSGQNRLALARRLATLSERAVLVTAREVSPDELVNLGFSCYVNTACPRLAYDDQIRFPVPVLSPPEFEILCGVRNWDEYEIDEIP